MIKRFVATGVAATIFSTAGIAEAATTFASSNSSHVSTSSQVGGIDTASQDALAAHIEQGMNQIFSVIRQGKNGVWYVDSDAAVKNKDLNVSSLRHIAAGLNGNRPSSGLPHGAVPYNYAKCVVLSAIPGGFLAQVNWGQVAKYVRQHAWKTLGVYIAKHETKAAAKDLLKFTPAGLAESIALGAVTCLWS